MKFRILEGMHVTNDGIVFNKGDIVESDVDLRVKFVNKFVKVGKSAEVSDGTPLDAPPPEPVPEQTPVLDPDEEEELDKDEEEDVEKEEETTDDESSDDEEEESKPKKKFKKKKKNRE